MKNKLKKPKLFNVILIKSKNNLDSKIIKNPK